MSMFTRLLEAQLAEARAEAARLREELAVSEDLRVQQAIKINEANNRFRSQWKENVQLREENARLRAEIEPRRRAWAQYERLCEENERMRDACQGLIDYRNRNTLNFQLEKADDFIHKMRVALEPPQPAAAQNSEGKTKEQENG